MQSVQQLPDVISAINSVIETSVFTDGPDVPHISAEFDNDCKVFRMDIMRTEAASVSCVYDPALFCDLLDDNIALSKFSTAVGSTTAKFQDPDSVIDSWNDPEPETDDEHIEEGSALMDVFVSAAHTEKPKGVYCELKTTPQLNCQDLNSKLSRNFGTNDRMLQYRRITSFFFTDTFRMTKKTASSRGYTWM